MPPKVSYKWGLTPDDPSSGKCISRATQSTSLNMRRDELARWQPIWKDTSMAWETDMQILHVLK